ncbi:MAG: DUF4157 domain-containing protein [Actinomycetota bacterium]
MDSFDYDEGRRSSRKPSEDDAARSKEVTGGEGRLGNQAMQRLVPKLRVQMKGTRGADVDDTIARAIQSKRGGGAALAEGSRSTMERTMGEDFSDVRVHADADADSLSRSVKAKAFTTGQDIFFRSGEYQPGSGEGDKLLAHELTHVVQQRGAPPAQQLEVSDPGDASEQQASAVAESVTARSEAGPAVGREAEEEGAMRVAAPEEEEELAMEAAPEEEELAMEGEEEEEQEEGAEGV